MYFVQFACGTKCSDNSSFFFNDTATTEIYTLSLHDALPICRRRPHGDAAPARGRRDGERQVGRAQRDDLLDPLQRSEEHTSELQSRLHVVCRLLLEKKYALYVAVSLFQKIGEVCIPVSQYYVLCTVRMWY